MAQEIKNPETSGTVARRYRDPFAAMRAEMDRLFDSFLGRGFFAQPALRSNVGTAAMIAPDVDIRENEKEIVFEAELPGIDEKDLQVSVRDGVLSLKGEKKSEKDEKKDTYHLIERSHGSFARSFRLPDSIDEGKISADFNKGMLRIVAPKRAEAAKAEKKISIGKG